MEVATMLVLSTAYITEHTCNTYLPTRATAYDKARYGWFVSTHIESGADDPADLALVLAFARGGGHDWVMFDADGPNNVDALPLYDWDEGDCAHNWREDRYGINVCTKCDVEQDQRGAAA